MERVVRLEERVPVRLEGGGSPILVGDQDQLEQALLNLLRNAADAALEGGGHVTLRWRVRGDELIVTVEDDGPGLAGASSLFVPLFTTKPGGSGIGLVLARAIAEAHGGSVALEDRAPAAQGCRATLVLPLAPRGRPAHRGFLRAASG
jgi:signal transduction histidine kinase